MPELSSFFGSDAGFAADWPGCSDFDPDTLNDWSHALPCHEDQAGQISARAPCWRIPVERGDGPA